MLVAPAAAMALDEFPVPAGTHPGGITTGPDGNLWFTEEGTNGIGRLTPSGAYTHFPLPNPVSIPDQITPGPDGRLWFTESGGNRIGAITTTGAITEYNNGGIGVGASPSGITVGPDGALWYTSVATSSIRRVDTSGNFGSPAVAFNTPTGSSDPSDIEVGADGRLWFTEQATTANKIGALNISTGLIQEFPTPTAGSEPSGIIATTGGILWFTESAASAIGRITTGGQITEFGAAGFSPSGIVAVPDGSLWYTLGFGNGSPTVPCTGTGDHSIGRITSGGTITNKIATPTPLSDPSDVTLGPDGQVWFSEFCGDKIGRIQISTPAPPPPPPPPVVVLSVSSLKMSPTSFRAAAKGASVSKKKKKKGKTGTKVTYTITTAASTKFTVERKQKGRKKGRKCVAPKKARKGRKCTRYAKVKGSFTHAGVAGKNTFKFSGRVRGKKLKPGNYRLVAVAKTATSTSKLKRKNFRIVR
jgi:virginiamycin B lyase